jgi:hypothetical protein
MAIRTSTRRRMSSDVAGDLYLTSYDVAFLIAAVRTGRSLGLVLQGWAPASFAPGRWQRYRIC